VATYLRARYVSEPRIIANGVVQRTDAMVMDMGGTLTRFAAEIVAPAHDSASSSRTICASS